MRLTINSSGETHSRDLLLKKIAMEKAITIDGMPEAGRVLSTESPVEGSVKSDNSMFEVSIDV